MDRSARMQAFAALAADLEGRDLACYAAAGRDPTEAILGEGPPDARLCLFGRDPGAEEVRQGRPFVGAAGRKLRDGLHRALFGRPAESADELLSAGERVFWANMVPFKPVGNKAWSPRVLRRFRPLVADLLLCGWRGRDVVTLGQGAFAWFGLGGAPEAAETLAAHWARPDRFTTSCEVRFEAADLGSGEVHARVLRLHPLPHPSPANAVWAARFPALLAARLEALGWTETTWRLPPAGP